MRYSDITNQNLDEAMLDGSHAYLYHATNLLLAVEIIKSNIIKAGGWESRGTHDPKDYGNRHKFVSMTRNLNFAKSWRTGDVVFVIDQNKLRSRFKVTPFDYFDYSIKGGVGFETDSKNLRSEAEEYVTKDIYPLDKYLVKILVKHSAEQRLLDIIEDSSILVPINPDRPRTLDNMKKLRRYNGPDDPKLADEMPGWLDRDVVLKHPLVQFI